MAYVEKYAGKEAHSLDLKSLQVKRSPSQSRQNCEGVTDKTQTLFKQIFLPQGYPYTVSDDYLQYQIWDTVQALASSLTGALAVEAVLRGAGVGNEAATPLAASLTWLVKDGLGMIGRILFTYVKGSELDFDCKKWRLVADILNDISFFVDLLSPLWAGLFLPFACLSSLLRCVVGVAGGATRATIVNHQARRNNLADVAAKDGSQETLVNVAALLISLVLLPAVSGKYAVIWMLFGLFTLTHLYANYRAVRSLNIRALNRKRASIAIRSFKNSGHVPTVEECNRLEPLFYAVTRGQRLYGCSLQKLMQGMSEKKADDDIVYLIDEQKIGAGDKVTPAFHILYNRRNKKGFVALSSETTAQTELFTFYALEMLTMEGENSEKMKLSDLEMGFKKFLEELKRNNFSTDMHHLGFDDWRYEMI